MPAGEVRGLHAEKPEHHAGLAAIKIGDLLRLSCREGMVVRRVSQRRRSEMRMAFARHGVGARWLGLALLGSFGAAIGFAAEAQTVRKCLGSDGQLTFTSGACPQGQRETAAYDATPQLMDRERADALARRHQQDEANSRYLDSLARGSNRRGASRRERARDAGSGPDGKRDHCDAARANREATLRRIGLKRSYDLLRRLDEQVYDACK